MRASASSRLSGLRAAALATVPRDAPEAWRGLDVVLAHAALLPRWHRSADDLDAVRALLAGG